MFGFFPYPLHKNPIFFFIFSEIQWTPLCLKKLRLKFLLSRVFFGLHDVGVLWGVGAGGLDLFPPPRGPGGGGQGPGDPQL